MTRVLAAILVGVDAFGGGSRAAAQDLPTFNVEMSCKGASSREVCTKSEGAAAGLLRARWPEISAAARARCVQFTVAHAPDSYLALLGCLSAESKRR